MQDPFEQLDKEFSQKVLSKFQREENYVRALVDTFSKNEKYALILGASLSTLFKNLQKGKQSKKHIFNLLLIDLCIRPPRQSKLKAV